MSESMSVLCVGDLHHGDEKGLRIKKGGTKLQGKMKGQWEHMAHVNDRVDWLVVNGDLCEGTHYKERGQGCWTTSAYEQVEDCMAALDMIDAKKVLITQGSGYHTGFNPSLDAYVAHKIGAVFEIESMLVVGGVQFWIKHEVPIKADESQRRQTLKGAFRDADGYEEEYGHTDIVVRSHAHYYLNVFEEEENGRKEPVRHHGIVLPGWKGKDAFQQRQKNGYVPHLGWVRFDIDEGEYEVTSHTFLLKNQDLVKVVA